MKTVQALLDLMTLGSCLTVVCGLVYSVKSQVQSIAIPNHYFLHTVARPGVGGAREAERMNCLINESKRHIAETRAANLPTGK